MSTLLGFGGPHGIPRRAFRLHACSLLNQGLRKFSGTFASLERCRTKFNGLARPAELDQHPSVFHN
jgi:hypothetical protein